MLATQPTLPIPEDFFREINAESSVLHRVLAFSGGTDIYTDLADHVEAQYQELVEGNGDAPITRLQLSYWVDTRTKGIHDHFKTLADPADIEVAFSGRSGLSSSMISWNARSVYSAITGELQKLLEKCWQFQSEIPDWLGELERAVDARQGAIEHSIQVLRLEATAERNAGLALLNKLPEQGTPQSVEPILRHTQQAYSKEMEGVVLAFERAICLDLLARTHDFFLPKGDSPEINQEPLPAIGGWDHVPAG